MIRTADLSAARGKAKNLINCERNAGEIDNNGGICLKERRKIGDRSGLEKKKKNSFFTGASPERFRSKRLLARASDFQRWTAIEIPNQNAFAKWKRERSAKATLCTLNTTEGLNVNELEHLFVTRISGI